jgi:hypothetical protein
LQLITNVVWEILYRDFTFGFDPAKNLVAMGNVCFSLAEIIEIFSEIRG